MHHHHLRHLRFRDLSALGREVGLIVYEIVVSPLKV